VDLGDGEPEIAVVGGIHGDEPCGEHAVAQLIADPPALQRPVRCLIANERALDAGTRYVDMDLNRAFPGDSDGATHEERLAAEIAAAVRGCTVLALHSTQSYDGLFSLVSAAGPTARRICPRLAVDAVVETAAYEGRIFSVVPDAIEVECGRQGSSAAKANADGVVREFLAAVGALPDPRDPDATIPQFEMGDAIPKPAGERYAVHAQNFERVAVEAPLATVDGELIRADTSFYPVLLSAHGYDDIFGYRSVHRGTLAVDPMNTDAA
jgi:predicted deacylase